MSSRQQYDLETDDGALLEHIESLECNAEADVFTDGEQWDEPTADLLEYSTEHPTVLFTLTIKEPYCIPSVLYIKDGKSYAATVTVTVTAFNPTFLV